jgi:hypothetical protein
VLISHERHYDAVDLGPHIEFLPHPGTGSFCVCESFINYLLCFRPN